MRIENLRQEEREGNFRALARVTWEGCPRPAEEIWFETPAECAGNFRADPNAFLLACLIPAMRHAERRVSVEGTICRRLEEGLHVAMALICQWYPDGRRPPRIEARRFEAAPGNSPRAAFFFSGGVDSLYLLLTNRRRFPLDHPASFRDALFVSGRDHPGAEDSDAARDHRARSREYFGPLARESSLDLVSITSNARQLQSDDEFFLFEYFGSFLAAAAMAFPGRWSAVSLASSWNVGNLRPWGSHPLLDPCFSTAASQVRHEGILWTRMQKLIELAEWDEALARLVVCNHAPGPPWLNCGRCGKCLLTLSVLLIAGRLEAATSFPPGSLTPETIARLPAEAAFGGLWRRRLDPLRSAGHTAIVRAIERKIREGESHQRWQERRGWKGRLRRWDDRWLGARLQKLRRA